MKTEQDPLDALGIQADRLDEENRAHLAHLVLPFARIDFENGKIHLTPTAEDLTAKEKVLICLLARLALSVKNPNFSAELSWNEIQQIANLPGGTIRPKLSELSSSRLVAKSGSLYKVLFSAIPNAQRLLANKIG